MWEHVVPNGTSAVVVLPARATRRHAGLVTRGSCVLVPVAQHSRAPLCFVVKPPGLCTLTDLVQTSVAPRQLAAPSVRPVSRRFTHRGLNNGHGHSQRTAGFSQGRLHVQRTRSPRGHGASSRVGKDTLLGRLGPCTGANGLPSRPRWAYPFACPEMPDGRWTDLPHVPSRLSPVWTRPPAPVLTRKLLF